MEKESPDGKVDSETVKKDLNKEGWEKGMPGRMVARRQNPFLPRIAEETDEEILEAGPMYRDGVEVWDGHARTKMVDLDVEDANDTAPLSKMRWDLLKLDVTGRESKPSDRSLIRQDLQDALGPRISDDAMLDLDDLLKVYQIRAHARVDSDIRDRRELVFFEALAKQLLSPKYRDRIIVAKYLHIIAIRDTDSAERFAEAKGLEPLQKFLRSSDDLQEYIPTVISSLAGSEPNREALLVKGTINALFRMSKKTAKNPNLMLSVSIAMAVLSVFPDTAQKLSENIDPVLEGLTIGDDVSKQNIGAALCMLTRTDANQSMIVYKNGVQAISDAMMNTTDVRVLFWMTATLANLARNPMNTKALLHLQVLDVLHFAAQSPDANVRRNVAWTILFLSNHKVAHQSVAVGVPISWIRDMLVLSLDANRETLDVLQLAFTHFVGVDKHSWTDPPAVQEFLQRFTPKQDKIKDTALRYVYQIMEEDVLEDLILSLLKGCCDSDQATKVDSLWLLNVLFLDQKYYSSVLKYGGITPLIVFAATDHEEVQRLSARTLVRVALEKDLLMEVKDELPLCALLLLCESTDSEVRKSAVLSLWIASIFGRDNRSMREQILDSCLNDVNAAELQATLRARLLPLSKAFVDSHTLPTNDCSLAGLQCLAALARSASPDVQGRVAFRLRELVKKATLLTPLSRKCLIFAMLAVQESHITQVTSSIVDAWYDLCMDFLTNFEGNSGFSVDCAAALMNMIMNPKSTSDLRIQSVQSLLNLVNVSPHVCAYLGDSYHLQRLLSCQEPEWGVSCLPLWIILVKVLASPLCPCTYALLLEHMDTINQILDAMRIDSSDNELQSLSVPVVALLEKCASWPILLNRLMTNHGGVFIDLLQLGLENDDDQFLISTSGSLVRVFHSISEERYEGMAKHYDDLLQRIFEIVKYAMSKVALLRPVTQVEPTTSSPKADQKAICEELLHLAICILASLAHHEEVRTLIAENSYLDETVLKMFLNLPYQRVLAQFFLFLNNCCHSESLFAVLSRQNLLKSLIHHADSSTDPTTLTNISQLLYQFCKAAGDSGDVSGLLIEDKTVNALFSIVKMGTPEAQEMAVQSFYHLATNEKVKRDIIRKGVLDCLCDLAMHGSDAVQSHAAWLVASLTVRGSSRDLMYQRNTLTDLTNLLSATNPQVLVQASWALAHVPLEEDIMNKLIQIGVAVKICTTLTYTSTADGDEIDKERDENQVYAQGALTIGTLSRCKIFRDSVVQFGVVELLVNILCADEEQRKYPESVHFGVAVAIREISQTRNYAQDFLKADVAPGLIRLLASSSRRIRQAAMAAMVPLLVVSSEMVHFIEAKAIKVMLENVELEEETGIQEFRTDVSEEVPCIALSLARAMRIFASDDRAMQEFRQYNGFESLMKLSESTSPEIQEEVAWTIGVLASDADAETCLAEIGAIDKLIYYTNTANELVLRRAQWSLGMLTPKAVRYNEILKQRGDKVTQNPDDVRQTLAGTTVLAQKVWSMKSTTLLSETGKPSSPMQDAPRQLKMSAVPKGVSELKVSPRPQWHKKVKTKLSVVAPSTLKVQRENNVKDVRDLIAQMQAVTGENKPIEKPPEKPPEKTTAELLFGE